MTKRIIYFCIALIAASFLLNLSGPAFLADQPTWIGLLPPLIAVGLAFATHNIYISLIAAVAVGGPLYFLKTDHGFFASIYKGVVYSSSKAFESLTDPFNVQILVFASFILIMIEVIQTAGGFNAIASKITSFAKTKKQTQFLTYIMGFFIFIDDYASTMIVGSSMRPLADKVKLSRQKLAFIVDATSAPIAGLAIVSTWIGYEVGLFNEVGKSLNIDQNGYAMFFDAISYRYYCFFMLIFISFNIISGIDFGKMKVAEEHAEKSGANHHEADTSLQAPVINAITALIPFGALLIYLFVSLWLDGKGPEQMTSFIDLFTLTHWRDVLSLSENNAKILAEAATLGLVLAIISGLIIGALNIPKLLSSLREGVKKALIPVVILVLAWTLKVLCDDLQTGPYLAAALGDKIQPALFPLCIFLLGAVTAFSTGTSWGTMAILIPIATPFAYHLDGDMYGLITMITLGSILDGAIMGDHCSPISDTTIMSSIATECNHMEHVKTQLPYSLLVGGLAIVLGYLPAGYGVPSYLSIFAVLGAYIVLFGYLKKRRSTSAPA